MTISRDDLIHALDNCFPYPIEHDNEVLGIAADNLLNFCFIEKNPEAELWQPEPTPDPDPEPEVEVPIGVPPKPAD